VNLRLACKPVAYVVQISEWDYVSGYVIKDYQVFYDESSYRMYLETEDIIKRAVSLFGIGEVLIGPSTQDMLVSGGGYAVVKDYRQ
jgi:hypothetical protein